MNREQAREQLRERAIRIRDESEQMVRDVEWWNNNCTDQPPMDCEPERVLARMADDQVAAIDRDDRDEMDRLSKAMVEHMTAVVREDEQQCEQ